MEWILTDKELPNGDEQVLCFSKKIGYQLAQWTGSMWLSQEPIYYPKGLFPHWVRLTPPVEQSDMPDEFAVRHGL